MKRAGGKFARRFLLASISAWAFPCVAGANPSGGTVTGGSATISGSGTKLTVTQTSSNAVIDWRSFDVAPGETTTFVQPSSTSLIVNRVNSPSPSFINGALNANGDVVIVNQNGVLFGKTAQINVNSLIASTADISNANAMAGRLAFDRPGSPTAAISNLGAITARQAGLVGLVAPSVLNAGVITARLGTIHLASGDSFTLDLYGDGLMEVKASPALQSQLVRNTGVLNAPGGTIALTAAAAAQSVDSLIDVGGTLNATSVNKVGGTIYIGGDGASGAAGNTAASPTATNGGGTVQVRGVLDASGDGAGERGGTITVTADTVGLRGSARLDVDGDTGGGTIQVGGGFHGQGTTLTALTTTIDPGATLTANATGLGDGGRIAVWSNALTTFAGTIQARGGASGGDGGWVETSGRQRLAFTGTVDLRAPKGQAGDLLLDPYDVVIQTNAGSPSDGCAGGVCAPTGSGSILTVAALQGALASGNVTVNTTGGGSDAGNITVANAVTWATGNALTLTANGAIQLGAPISATGAGAITLNAPGGIVVNAGGGLSSAGGAITLNNAVTLNAPLSIASGGGAVTFASTVDGANSLTVDSGAGTTAFGGVVGGSNALTNLTVTSDALSFAGKVYGTGNLTLQPSTPSLTLHVDGSSSGWFLSGAEVGYIQSDWSLLTLGAASDTGVISLNHNTWATALTLTTSATGSISESSGQSLTTSGAALTFNGPASIQNSNTTTNGVITFNGPVSVAGYSWVQSGSANTIFNSTIDSPVHKTLNVWNSGMSTFGGNVGGAMALGALNLTGASTLKGNITTSNAPVSLGGAVTLGANAAISTGGSAVSFGSTVNGSYNLTVNSGAGAISFGGALGGSTPLGQVSLTSGAALTLPAITAAGLTATTTTAGANITVGGNLTWSTGNLVSLSSGGAITINAGVTIANSYAGSSFSASPTSGTFGAATCTPAGPCALPVILALRADNTSAVNASGVSTNSYGVTNNGTINMSASSGAVSIFNDPGFTAVNGTQTANSAWTAPSNASVSSQFTTYRLVNGVGDLAAMSLSGVYALGSNIDGGGAAFNANTPLGAFSGVLDGQYGVLAGGSVYGVANLTMTNGSTANVGLFGRISAGGIVRNLTLGLSVTDSYSAGSVLVGGLAGVSNGQIANLTSTGSVSYTGSSSSVEIGGLVGQTCCGAGSTVTNAMATGNVTFNYTGAAASSAWIGGLVGLDNNSAGANISGSSTSTGVITAQYTAGGNGLVAGQIGGLIGGTYTATLTNTSAAEAIYDYLSGTQYIGGLVGKNYGPITGASAGSTGASGSVTYAGASTTVSIGGLVGSNSSNGIITNAAASGAVSYTATSASSGATANVGGLVGATSGAATTISGSTASGAVTFTYQSAAAATAANVGGLVGTNSGSAANSISGSSTSTGVVTAQYGPGGTGAVPASVGALVGYNYNTSPTSIVNSTAAEAVNDSLTGAQAIGGLVGSNQGTISGGGSSGAVAYTGAATTVYLGGLAGYNYQPQAIISNATASGAVSATTSAPQVYVGGLVGLENNSAGSILNSAATGNVTFTFTGTATNAYYARVGGLVGGYNNPAATTTLSGSSTALGVVTAQYGSGGSGAFGSVSVGGLVGITAGNATAVVNSTAAEAVNDSLLGGQQIGGLAGLNQGTTTGSSASGAVAYTGASSSVSIGGLAGQNSGVISSSSASGAVAYSYTGAGGASVSIGGLVGANTSSATQSISGSSTAAGTVIAQYGSGGSGSVTGYVGGLVGNNSNTGSSLIVDSTAAEAVSDSLSGLQFIGGLVGQNLGVIAGSSPATSFASGAVAYTGASTNVSIGGLVGSNNNTASAIVNSAASGNVTYSYTGTSAGSYAYVGGLVGQIATGSATSISGSSTALGAVTAQYGPGGSGDFAAVSVGGLAGYNNNASATAIVNSTSSEAVSVSGLTGGQYIGGLVGYNFGTITGASPATSFASGSVTYTGPATAVYIGGLVGADSGDPAVITNSAASGNVTFTYTGATPGSSASVGGLLGWNKSTSTLSGDSTATGVVTAQYGSGATAAMQAYVGGLVGFGYFSTANSISNSTSSENVNDSLNGAQYVGGLVGSNNGTITGTSAATSFASGQVSYIGSSAAVYIGGLVGQNSNTSSATISNTAASGNVNYTYTGTASGASAYVGGLVGQNASSAANSISGSSAATGSVTAQYGAGGSGAFANAYLGGLVGQNSNTSTTAIVNSTAAEAVTDSLTGAQYVGGLVGQNSGTITGTTPATSYASGAVAYSGASTNVSLGGLVGSNSGASAAIVNSAASGNVSYTYTGTTAGASAYVGGLVGQIGNGAAMSVSGSSAATGVVTGQYRAGGSGDLSASDFGGLVGVNNNASAMAIFNSTSSEAVTVNGLTGQQFIGGLVGYNFGGISGASAATSFASGAVAYTGPSTTVDIGGLVGGDYGNSAVISNSAASGNVTFTYTGATVGTGAYVGGLLGWNKSSATISGTSTATGAVVAQYGSGATAAMPGYVGGLVGYNYYSTITAISDSSSSESVTDSLNGAQAIGGLVGSNTGTITGTTAAKSFASGPVSYTGASTSVAIGGLVGLNASSSGGAITNSAASGNVTYTYTGTAAGASASVGGLLGQNTSSAANSISGTSTSTGWVTAQYGAGGSGAFSGASVGGLVGQNNNTSASAIVNSTSSEAVSDSLTGTQYVGGLVGQNLGTITGTSPATSFASGAVAYTGASTSVFLGGLVGQNTGGSAVISNSAASGNVTFSYTNTAAGTNAVIGGLVGQNASTAATSISGAFAAGGAVTAQYGTGGSGSDNALVGGLVGQNSGAATAITTSYATETVTDSLTGTQNIGGLVGNQNAAAASLANVYATGPVSYTGGTAGSKVGGLVGYNQAGTISSAYATGYVSPGAGTGGGLVGSNTGSVVNSYWDVGTTGQASSAGGTSQTTAQLQAALPAGFSGTTWGILAGASYPYLASLFSGTPQVVSGIAYSDQGTTPLAGATVAGVLNGAVLPGGGVTTTGANGYYYYLLPPNTISASGSQVGVGVVAGASGLFTDNATGSLTGQKLYAGQVSINSAQTTLSATTADLATALGGLGSPLLTLNAGAITLTAGETLQINSPAANLALDRAITASGGAAVILNASGGVTQSAAITTPNLLLTGTGTYTLTNAANSVGTVAGSAGAVSLTDGAALTVGTVAGVSGLTTTGAVTLSSASDITVSTPITTGGGGVRLQSNNAGVGNGTSETGAGAVDVTAAITTGGGDIRIGGGSLFAGVGGVGYAIGDTTYNTGVTFNGATLSAGGGTIVVNGLGYNQGAGGNYGVYIRASTVATTGSGTLTVNGIGQGIASSSGNIGVFVKNGSTISTVDGALTVVGSGGLSSGGQDYGVALSSYGSNSFRTTGSGNLIVTGIGGGDGTTGQNIGVESHSSNGFYTSGTGSIIIRGVAGANISDYGVGTANGAAIDAFQTVSGAITLYADKINFAAANNLVSGGGLIIAPYTNSALGVGAAAGGVVNLNETQLGYLSAASYTFGAATTGNGSAFTAGLTVNTSNGFAKPLTFATGGGGAITLTALPANGNNAITFNGPVVLGANATLSSGTAPTTFSSTIDSTAGQAYGLTLSGAGPTIFVGAVGGTTPIGALSVAGPSTFDANVTTQNAAVTLTGAVTLGGNVALNSGSATTSFGATVDGAVSGVDGLIASAGGFGFGGVLGGTTPLGQVSLTSAGALTLPAITATGLTATTTAGALTAGGAVTVNGSGAATLSSFSDITVSSPMTLNGGTLTLQSNNTGTGNGTSETGSGEVSISAAVATNGGNIHIGGGSAFAGVGGLGYAIGSAANIVGVNITAAVNAGGSANGGAIVVNGMGFNGVGGANHGIYVGGATVSTNFAGTISAYGVGQGTGSSTSDIGIFIRYSGVVSTVDGDLKLFGTGGGAGVATSVIGANTFKTTGAGNLIVTGISRNSGGVLSNVTGGFQTTGAGSLTIYAAAGAAANDYGLTFSSGGGQSNLFRTVSGPIYIYTDSLHLDTPSQINSGGAMTIAPYSNVSMGVGANAGGTFNISETQLGYLSAKSYTFGAATTGNGTAFTAGVTVNTTNTFAAPVTFVSPGALTLAGVLTDSQSTGTAVTFATGGAFTSTGSVALTGAGNPRWLVYANAPASLSSGATLDSGNTPVWNTTYPAAISQSGDRYVFAFQPTLTITTTDATKTYGVDGTAALQSHYTVSGLQPALGGAYLADTPASAISGAPTLASAGAAATATVAGGPYPITATAAGLTLLNGYQASFVNSGLLTVNPALLTLTVSAFTVASKTYDGINTATITGDTLVGVQPGDIGRVDLAPTDATFNSVHAGAVTASLTGTSLLGPAAGNYQLNLAGAPTATATIFPKALTVTGLSVPASKVYDGGATALVSGAPSLQAAEAPGAGTAADGRPYSGDVVPLSGSATATYDSPHVSTASLVTFGGVTTSNSDYTLSLGSQAASITPLAVTLSGTRTYDGTAGAAAANLAITNRIAGDTVSLASGSAVLSGKDAGPQSVTDPSGLVLANNAAGDYTLAGASGTVTITPLALTLSGARPYDGSTTAAAPNLSITNRVAGDAVSLASGSAVLSGKDAGAQAIADPSGLVLANNAAGDYTLAGASGTVTITPLALTLSGTRTYDGTAGAAAANLSITNRIAGDTVSLASGSVALSGKDAGPQSVTDPSGLVLANNAAGDYTLAGASGTVTITPLALTLSGTRTYDGSTTAAAASLAITNRIAGDTVSLASGSAVLSGKDAGSQAIADPSGLVLANNAAGDYTLAGASGTVTITPLVLTLSGTRTYDGTVNTAAANLSITNRIAGDTVSLASGSVALSGKDAGAQAIIDSSGLVLANNAAGDYTLAGASGTVTITPLALTLSGTRTYDGSTTAAAASLSITNRIAGDTLSLASGGVVLSGKDAGPQAIADPSGLVLANNAAGDYTLTGATGTVTINPLAVILTGTKTYDGTANAAAADLAITNRIAGDSVSLASGGVALAGKHAGAQNITDPSGLVLANNGAGDYTLAGASGTVTIDPLPVTLSGTQVYSGVASAAAANLAITNKIAGDGVSLASGVATLVGKDAGVEAIADASGLKLSGASAGDYTVVGATGAVSVSRAALTVTAADDAKFVTQADTPGYGGAVFTGLVNGETASVLAGTLTIVRTNLGVDTANTYAGVLQASGLSSNNYKISYVNGDYTIVPADELLVKLKPVTTTYGATPTYAVASAQYLDAGKVVTDLSVSTTVTGSTVTVTDGAGGTASFTLGTTHASLSGANLLKAGGYGLTYANLLNTSANFHALVVTGSEQVAPATIGVAAGGLSKVYDATGTMTNLTLSPTGVFAGDAVTVSGVGAYGQANAGSSLAYGVTALTLDGADAANYALASPTLTGSNGTITPRTVTLSATKTYDATTSLAGAVTVGGTVAGQTLTYAGAQAANANVAANGSNFISALTLQDGAGGGLAANYQLPTLNTANAPVTITPKTVTVSASKTYDGTTSLAGDVTLGGTVAGQTLTYAGAQAASANVAANGANAIAALTLADGTGSASNYQLPPLDAANAPVTIHPATLTVTADPQSMTYGASRLPTLTATITGFVAGETEASAGLTGQAALSTSAKPYGGVAGRGSSVGAYGITAAQGSLAAANYGFAFMPGVLTVTPAPLTVRADNQTITVGSPLPPLSVSYIGLVNGDTAADLTSPAHAVSATTADAPIGAYVGTLTASGAVDPNYMIGYAAGDLTISPPAIGQIASTVVVNSQIPQTAIAVSAGPVPPRLAPTPSDTGPTPARDKDFALLRRLNAIDVQMSPALKAKLGYEADVRSPALDGAR